MDNWQWAKTNPIYLAMGNGQWAKNKLINKWERSEN